MLNVIKKHAASILVLSMVFGLISLVISCDSAGSETPNAPIGNVKAATAENVGVVQVSWEVSEEEQFAGYQIELKGESETIIHYTLHETGKSEYSMEIQVPAGTYSTTVTGVQGGDDASRNTLSTKKGSAGSTVEIQTEGTPVPVLTVSGQVTGTVAATEVIATVGWSIPENSEITKGTLYWAAGSSVSVWKYTGSKDITADLETASTDISGLEVGTQYTFIALWESSAGIRSVSTIQILEAQNSQAEAPAVLEITVTADATTEEAILTVSWVLEGYNAGKTIAGEAVDIQKILVYWKQGSGAIDTGENTADTHQEVGASDTEYAIQSLEVESSYSVVVKVVNTAELSSISEQIEVDTPKASSKSVADYSFSYGALAKKTDGTVSVSPVWSASAITAAYSTTDTLPDGLTLNPTDGTISGTYTATGYPTEYTITAKGTEKYEGETTAVFFDTFVLESYTKVETGTAISTREELEGIKDDLAGNYYLTANIDLSGANWEPVGSESAPFKGNFQGNGHIIYNLTIASLGNNQGLFAAVGSTAKVENLGIGISSIKGNAVIGAVAGRLDGGSATNIAAVAMSAPSADAPTLEASGKVVINRISASYVGGLVGRSSGTVSGYVTGAVTGNANYVGGLVGYVGSGTVSGYATGAVKGGGEVGGLVGEVWRGGTVSGYATGAVTGSGENVGGLVGSVESGTVRGYATGAVTSTSSEVGGLVGKVWSGTVSGYATGAVTSTSNTVGGLVGEVGSSTASGYATGAVRGSTEVGGLVGYVGSSTVSGYATGAVSVTIFKSRVGGLVGSVSGEVVSSTVSGYATGDVFGDIYKGGLVGANSGTVSGYWDQASTKQANGVGTGTLSSGGGISATKNIALDSTTYTDSGATDPSAAIFNDATFLTVFELPGKAKTWPKLKASYTFNSKAVSFDWSGFDYIEWKQPTVSDTDGDGKIEVIVN